MICIQRLFIYAVARFFLPISRLEYIGVAIMLFGCTFCENPGPPTCEFAITIPTPKPETDADMDSICNTKQPQVISNDFARLYVLYYDYRDKALVNARLAISESNVKYVVAIKSIELFGVRRLEYAQSNESLGDADIKKVVYQEDGIELETRFPIDLYTGFNAFRATVALEVDCLNHSTSSAKSRTVFADTYLARCETMDSPTYASVWVSSGEDCYHCELDPGCE